VGRERGLLSSDGEREVIVRTLVEKEFEAHDKLVASYERALGKLAIRFSLLHFVLEQLCWEIWGMEGRLALIMPADLPTKHLVEKLKQGAEHRMHSIKGQKSFSSILKKVETAARKRNELLHALWIIRKDKPTLCFVRKPGVMRGMDSPLLEEINDLNKKIWDILGELEEFHKRRPLAKA
jgi:hypothetical protein